MQHIIQFSYGLVADLKPQMAFKKECQVKTKTDPWDGTAYKYQGNELPGLILKLITKSIFHNGPDTLLILPTQQNCKKNKRNTL